MLEAICLDGATLCTRLLIGITSLGEILVVMYDEDDNKYFGALDLKSFKEMVKTINIAGSN